MNTRSVYVVGGNLRKLRTIYGYTQSETAALLNVCRTSYLKYESGDKMPGIDTLLNIANLYHISIDVIYEADPAKFRALTYYFRCLSRDKKVD